MDSSIGVLSAIGCTLARPTAPDTYSSNMVRLFGVGPYVRKKRTQALDGGAEPCSTDAKPFIAIHIWKKTIEVTGNGQELDHLEVHCQAATKRIQPPNALRNFSEKREVWSRLAYAIMDGSLQQGVSSTQAPIVTSQPGLNKVAVFTYAHTHLLKEPWTVDLDFANRVMVLNTGRQLDPRNMLAVCIIQVPVVSNGFTV